MKQLVLIILAIFVFTGCTLKQTNANKTTQNIKVEKSIEEDDFSQEFEDEEVEEFDPLSGYNRAMTTFNDNFYTYVAIPTAKGYRYVMPETARLGVSNFFNNLAFPIRFVNNLLQLKFHNSWEELQRFLLNSTFGIAGLIDVAELNDLGLKEHDEDFGQTLGFYGVKGGFHIVLPILGPSNVRDTLSFAVDSYMSPITKGDTSYYIPDNMEKSIGLNALKITNRNSFQPDAYELLKKDAIDLYPFLKEIYTKKREKEIKE